LKASSIGEVKDRWPWISILLLGIICVLVLGSFVLSLITYKKAVPGTEAADRNSKIISTQQEQRMAQCRSQLLEQIKPDKIDLKLLAGLHGLCYARVNEEDTLTEFGIRRGAFLNQQSETGILMWMVVLITISGVLLAGIQLLAGFKLAVLGKAAFDQGGQISLEANKLSISSSVTGVLVLAISLCFFYVFSKEIYLIRVQGDDSSAASVRSVTSALDMKAGWDPSASSGLQPLPPNFGKNMVPIDPAVLQEAAKQKKSTPNKLQ
jgi:hypothetical protein